MRGVAKQILALMILMVASQANATDPANERVLRRLSEMVPEGRQIVKMEVRDLLSSRRYDDEGKLVEFGADYDNYTLPGGILTHFDSSLRGQRYRLVFSRGITENFAISAILPWGVMTQRVDFSASSNSDGSDQTAAVQSMLAGLGYKRVQTTETSGILDPVFGARFRAYAGQYDTVVLATGVRLGMAAKDDPDNLVDFHWEDGSTDLLVEGTYVRLLPAGLDMKMQARYAYQTADHVRARARGVNATLVDQSKTERLGRDLGDMLEASMEMGYRTGYWRYNLTLEMVRKNSDDYHSPRGQDVSGLEADTNRSVDALRGGFAWLGAKASIGLPLILEMQYRDSFQGRNVYDSRDYYLALTMLM